jgi:hypothetical protein
MGRHIDRHPCHISCEIRTVVKIETAQEVLVGLAVTRMLGNDQPGHHFQHFARTLERHGGQPLSGYHPLTAGHGQPFQVFDPGPDFDGRQFGRFVRRGPGYRQQEICTIFVLISSQKTAASTGDFLRLDRAGSGRRAAPDGSQKAKCNDRHQQAAKPQFLAFAPGIDGR